MEEKVDGRLNVRQMKTKFRKPLVVFSPKSLLRHPLCVSTQEELANGSFQETIDDTSVDKSKVKTVVFCTGKFYYDIVAEREKLEQLKGEVHEEVEHHHEIETAAADHPEQVDREELKKETVDEDIDIPGLSDDKGRRIKA